MKLTSSFLERWDKKFVWHPFTQHFLWDKEKPLIVSKAKGIYFQDTHGKKYLDGVSSLWVNLHGHNHPGLNAAIKKQLAQVAHSTFLGLSHPCAIQLAKSLAEITPKGLTRSFFSDNGATSVEVALKMAFQYWIESEKKVRPEFLAIRGSYHGDTLGAVSVGGIGTFHSKFKPLLFKTNFAFPPACHQCPFNKNKIRHRYRLGEKISRVPKPGDKRAETGCHWECLKDVQKIIKQRNKKIAAALIEPVVQGAAGINVMPPGYVAGFQRLCRQNKVLLIVDEVATGFGRTGTMFASFQEGIKPDFLCLAKGLTAGYLPLAVTMTSNKIFKAFYGPIKEGRTFFHGHSYTANPLAAAVAVANLELFKNGKLLEKTAHTAKLMKDELRALESLPTVESIRQAGLMVGIQLIPTHQRMGARVCKKLLRQGIWLRPLGDVIVFMPPLVISALEIKKVIHSIKSVILNELKT